MTGLDVRRLFQAVFEVGVFEPDRVQDLALFRVTLSSP
jgi:hypothetical protein